MLAPLAAQMRDFGYAVCQDSTNKILISGNLSFTPAQTRRSPSIHSLPSQHLGRPCTSTSGVVTLHNAHASATIHFSLTWPPFPRQVSKASPFVSGFLLISLLLNFLDGFGMVSLARSLLWTNLLVKTTLLINLEAFLIVPSRRLKDEILTCCHISCSDLSIHSSWY